MPETGTDAEFTPTSTHPNWKGKIKCVHCGASGWPRLDKAPATHWTLRHGAFCTHTPERTT